jgi:predicted nuclease of predicted toxin-antitoxin system
MPRGVWTILSSMPPNRRGEIWLDAHLSPSLAAWIAESLDLPARSFERLGLRDAADEEVFCKAREAGAVVMTKDADFPRLLERLGPPPTVIWLTFGNTSSARLRDLLQKKLEIAMNLLDQGEQLVEISADDR